MDANFVDGARVSAKSVPELACSSTPDIGGAVCTACRDQLRIVGPVAFEHVLFKVVGRTHKTHFDAGLSVTEGFDVPHQACVVHRCGEQMADKTALTLGQSQRCDHVRVPDQTVLQLVIAQ